MKCIQCEKELPKWTDEVAAAWTKRRKEAVTRTGPGGIRITSGVHQQPTAYCSKKCREDYRKASNARREK